MKFLKYLSEEYAITSTLRGFSAEVFVNPDRKELRNMKFVKYIICAINPKKFISYMWDGETGIHHSTVMNSLLNNGLWHDFIMMGWARYEPTQGKIKNSTANSELSMHLKSVDIKAFKTWLKKYFIMDGLPSNLLEEYKTSIRVRNEQVPVFTNPNKKELNELGYNIRFVIHPFKQEIYCWDANKALHDSMINKLNLIDSKFITLGQGQYYNGKFDIINLVNRGKISKEDFQKIDGHWLKRVFDKLTVAEWLRDGWYYGRG